MKAIVAILSVALVALGGGVIHLWRQLDASRHQVAGLQAQVDNTPATARQPATFAPSPTDAAPIATVTASSKEREDAIRKETEKMLAVLKANAGSPEGIANSRVITRGLIPTDYPDVGKVLGLSPDEVERLYDLLAEQRFRKYGPDAPMDAGSLARVEQSEKDELASLLGSKYAKWQQYTTELPTRKQVKNLDAVLSEAGMPLSDAQRNALVPAVAAVERINSQEREARYGQGSRASAFSRYSPEARQNILDAAAAHLTPQQLESYSQMLERLSSQESRLRGMLPGAQ